MEVVEGQQQRLLGGQAAGEGGHGVERPPPLQLRRGPLVAGQVQQPAQLGTSSAKVPAASPAAATRSGGRASAATRTASATGCRNSDRSAS